MAEAQWKASRGVRMQLTADLAEVAAGLSGIRSKRNRESNPVVLGALARVDTAIVELAKACAELSADAAEPPDPTD